MDLITHSLIPLKKRNYYLSVLICLSSIITGVAISFSYLKIFSFFLSISIAILLLLKNRAFALQLYIFTVVGLNSHHFITFFEVIDIDGKTIFFTDILLGLGVIAFLLHYLDSHYSVKTSLDLPIILFLLIACFSLLRGTFYGRTAISDFRPYLYAVSFYFITTRLIRSDNEVRKVIHLFLISSLLIPFFSIYAYMTQSSVLLTERVGQAGSHSFFMMNTVFFLVIYSVDSGKYRKYIIPTICFLILVILIGYSRTTYVVFLLGFIAISLGYGRKFKYLLRFVFLSLLLFSIMFTGIYLTGKQGGIYEEKFTYYTSSIFDSNNYAQDRGIRARLWMYEQELNRIKQHFIIGVPMGSGWQYDLDRMGEKKPMHNCYLAILSRTGLVGFILFFFMLISFCKRTIRYLKNNKENENSIYLKWLLLSIFCNMIFIFFNAEMSNTGTFIFIFIFIGLAEILIKHNNYNQLQA